MRAASSGSVSKLSYTPQNTMDYGTLLCSAANTVGEQRDPCVFHIIMAGAGLFIRGVKKISKKFTIFGEGLYLILASPNQKSVINFAVAQFQTDSTCLNAYLA